MFQRLRQMTVSQRINHNKAVLTYKALNNLTPAYISDLLTPTAIAYNRNLMSSENGSIMVPKTRTSFTPAHLQFQLLSCGTLSLHQLNKQLPRIHLKESYDRIYFILETAIVLMNTLFYIPIRTHFFAMPCMLVYLYILLLVCSHVFIYQLYVQRAIW